MNNLTIIASLCLLFVARLGHTQTDSAVEPLKTRTFHVAATKSVGYLSVVAGLQIIDLSSPGKVKALSTVVLPQSANYAFINGNLVYVAEGPAGVFVIDVSDATNPRTIGHVSTPGSAMMVDLRDNLLAVACGSVGVTLVDVSTPSNPTTLWSSDNGRYDGYVRGVKFYDGRLFVCAGSAGVRIVELDPAGQGRVVATVRTARDARDIDFYRTHAFVADGVAGVSVLQIATGEAPSLVATYPTEDLAHGVVFHKGFVFVADGLRGVASFEFTRDGSLKRGEQLDTQEGYANKVSVFDHKLFVANDFKGMLVFNVRTPREPVRLH